MYGFKHSALLNIRGAFIGARQIYRQSLSNPYQMKRKLDIMKSNLYRCILATAFGREGRRESRNQRRLELGQLLRAPELLKHKEGPSAIFGR